MEYRILNVSKGCYLFPHNGKAFPVVEGWKDRTSLNIFGTTTDFYGAETQPLIFPTDIKPVVLCSPFEVIRIERTHRIADTYAVTCSPFVRRSTGVERDEVAALIAHCINHGFKYA